MGWLDRLQIFQGDTTPASGQLYARCPRPMDGADYRLMGNVRGPYSLYARTLPAAVDWMDLGGGPELMARAAVPDPCGWSLDTPATYRAALQLARDGVIVETTERMVGFRRLGVRGRSLCLEGQRWVLRGVSADLVDGSWQAWRTSRLAMVCREITESLCRDTSLHGVPLVWHTADGTYDAQFLQATLQRWASWPSFAAVICEASAWSALERRGLPNVLMACWAASIPSVAGGLREAPELQVGEGERTAMDAEGAYLAVRRNGCRWEDLPAARHACEQLQRELTPLNLAGYLLLSAGYARAD